MGSTLLHPTQSEPPNTSFICRHETPLWLFLTLPGVTGKYSSSSLLSGMHCYFWSVAIRASIWEYVEPCSRISCWRWVFCHSIVLNSSFSFAIYTNKVNSHKYADTGQSQCHVSSLWVMPHLLPQFFVFCHKCGAALEELQRGLESANA